MKKFTWLAVGIALVALAAALSADREVTLCHKGDRDERSGRTLSVSASAVPGHLRHGDHLGGCSASPHR